MAASVIVQSFSTVVAGAVVLVETGSSEGSQEGSVILNRRDSMISPKISMSNSMGLRDFACERRVS